MKRKGLRLLVLVFALVVVSSVIFTGCKSDSDTEMVVQETPAKETTTEETTTGKPTETDPYAEKLKLVWFTFNIDYPQDEVPETTKLIEEKFNVEIEVPNINTQEEEEWTLYWASGNTADKVTSFAMKNYFYQFADQGLIRTINMEMLDNYAPDWMDTVYSMFSEDIVLPQIVYNDDVWCMPYTTGNDVLTGVMGVKKSWLENIGMDEAPKTLDELYQMIHKFTYEDPDGNGVDDTYGLHFLESRRNFEYFWGTYGMLPNAYYDMDGSIIYTSATEEFKEGVKILAQWYEEGLIDPEFVTDDRSKQKAKWQDGVIGLVEEHPVFFWPTLQEQFYDLARTNNPDEEVVVFPAITGDDGISGSSLNYPTVTNYAVYFGADTSDEKVERIMRIQNEIVKDKELYITLYYGEEGKHFNFDEEGKPIPVAEMNTPEIQYKDGLTSTWGIVPITLNFQAELNPKENMDIYAIGELNNKIFKSVAFSLSSPSTAYTEKSADVEKIYQEFYFNAITGKIDVDAEWDNYLNDLSEAGLDEILSEFGELIIR